MRVAKCKVAAQCRSVLAVICAVGTIGWLGAERDRASEGNRLYDASRYEEAETAYGEGLVDYPESEYLRFNLGAAQYRQGNFTDAATTLEKMLPDVTGKGPIGPPPSKTPELAAEAAYNIGNARYRMGKQAEEQNPQQAIALYEQALLAYKRAMALHPDDDAPKFNHEFVERQVAEWRKRLEEEQKQQQQQDEQQEKHQNEQQEGQEEGQPQGQQEGQQQEPGEGEKQETPQEEKSGAQQPKPEEAPEEQAQQESGGQQDESQDTERERGAHEQAGAGAEKGAEPSGDEMTAAEARTLIDAARGEEVDPAEIQRQLGVAGIGEPVEDW